MEPKFPTVETERMPDWKLRRRLSLEEKRRWKYGAAARNMFLIYRQYLLAVGEYAVLPCPQHGHAQQQEDRVISP